jgi:hypothetical protein
MKAYCCRLYRAHIAELGPWARRWWLDFWRGHGKPPVLNCSIRPGEPMRISISLNIEIRRVKVISSLWFGWALFHLFFVFMYLDFIFLFVSFWFYGSISCPVSFFCSLIFSFSSSCPFSISLTSPFYSLPLNNIIVLLCCVGERPITRTYTVFKSLLSISMPMKCEEV